jgi:cytochrome P450
VLEKEGEHGGMSRKEMYGNSNIFMIAGTETTATLLSGLTYYLLVNPDKMKKLTSEIRHGFVTEDEITIERLQALKYLNACLEEGLRMYPPVPSGLPRNVPPGGAEIDGQSVPAGVGHAEFD